MQETGQIETDFHKDDAYQNCSVFSADGLRLVTGGADGCVRLWRVSGQTLFSKVLRVN